MISAQTSSRSSLRRLGAAVGRLIVVGTCAVLAACGGSADAPPPPEGGPVLAVPPTITQQPADASVTVGQTASFTVAAAGTAPLAYQWQRNGADIAGATETTYSTAATTLADSGATYRAVVTNVAGAATSRNATLTVTMSAPVLTITPQPAAASVVAGSSASFTVGGTCSSGSLVIQWQRNQGNGTAFADIADATAATYTFATTIADNGAQFRARLDCSGQSAATSSAATLTVTAPSSVVLSLLPTVGLRSQAALDIALTGIDADTAGSFTFIAGNSLKRLSADLSMITAVAGSGFTGSVDGPAASASFQAPRGLAHDASGNIYVADSGNHTIRLVTPDGTVSTLAGLAGSSGSLDGTGGVARFSTPTAIAIGPDGDLYVAEQGSHLIRRVTSAGVVTTYAGSTQGYADGAPGAAQFSAPDAIVVASNGDLYIADSSNSRIRRIVRSGNVAGAVQTFAGSGFSASGDRDGVGTAAVLISPQAMALRGNTLTVRDSTGLLRQIDLTSAVVTTLLGKPTDQFLHAGDVDGPAATAEVNSFGGITIAPNGGFMLADYQAVRSVSAAGDVKTIAITSAPGATPTGTGVLAQLPFCVPSGRSSLAVDPAGNVDISDGCTRQVRRISPAGVVTLAAGLAGGIGGSSPFVTGLDNNGVGSGAQFLGALGYSIASDSSGALYVSDYAGIRKIAPDNTTTSFAGSVGILGAANGAGTAARFNAAFGMAVDAGGNLFVADAANNAVRRVDPAGNVTTYAGAFGQGTRVDGPIATARFEAPTTVAFASDGSLYVGDNGSLRRISADGSTVSTLTGAGGGTGRFAIDSAGTIYYGESDGLHVLTAGAAASTLLIRSGAAVVLGADPRLINVDSIAVLGPKRLVILSGSMILVATLP
jgi:sugar lactone lactonase YvrE